MDKEIEKIIDQNFNTLKVQFKTILNELYSSLNNTIENFKRGLNG